MSEDGTRVSAGNPIFRIVEVTPIGDGQIKVEWENGRIADIDLASRLTHRLLVPVLATREIFNTVEVEEYGWAVWWPSLEGAAIPSSHLYAWADGKDSEFA